MDSSSSLGFTLADFPRADLERQGYALIPGVFEEAVLQRLAEDLAQALHTRQQEDVLRSRGETYGARNLLAAHPAIAELVMCSSLRDVALQLLGPQAGIVRGLFFDKPPGRSWSLAWHRDKTIAVQRNDLPSEYFRRPTRKAGVAHVEAPTALLEQMLTFRIHLDAMTEENGPLAVIPGSHQIEREPTAPPQVIYAQAGDVLAMRPLLSHSSQASHPDTTQHRRIVHLELSATPRLPDGYEWERFLPLAETSR